MIPHPLRLVAPPECHRCGSPTADPTALRLDDEPGRPLCERCAGELRLWLSAVPPRRPRPWRRLLRALGALGARPAIPFRGAHAR